MDLLKLQLQLKMTTEITALADFTYVPNATKLPVAYLELSLLLWARCHSELVYNRNNHEHPIQFLCNGNIIHLRK